MTTVHEDPEIITPLIVEEVTGGSEPGGLVGLFKSMPLTIKIASIWLTIALLAAAGAWIPRLRGSGPVGALHQRVTATMAPRATATKATAMELRLPTMIMEKMSRPK